jgi:hypothetical protein
LAAAAAAAAAAVAEAMGASLQPWKAQCVPLVLFALRSLWSAARVEPAAPVAAAMAAAMAAATSSSFA